MTFDHTHTILDQLDDLEAAYGIDIAGTAGTAVALVVLVEQAPLKKTNERRRMFNPLSLSQSGMLTE